MAFFDWEDAFGVGVLGIDQQHQRLIALINQLHDAIERSNELATLESVLSELAAVTSVVDELISYTQYHFSTEEGHMLQYAYPGYDEHKAEHEQFVGKVQDFRRRFDKQKTRLSLDIAEFLMNWWRGHILNSDKKCGAFLCEKGLR